MLIFDWMIVQIKNRLLINGGLDWRHRWFGSLDVLAPLVPVLI